MKTATFACFLASASAFAPAQQSASSSAIKATAEFDGMIGVSSETAGKFFDPIGLSQWAPADYLRKVELSNGRAAMLATVGWEVPKVFMFDSNDVSSPDPIKAILEADPQWWAQFILFCGTVEAIKYRGEMEGKSYTGDGPAVIDWTNTWGTLNDKEKEGMRLKELKNGRLAMLAFASYISNYYIPGSVPLLPEGF
eukprot:CAMPEP_0198142588 /NCGR_PEP_ID=MMETSP1443-20131203/5343_1 /TAXON_ID=186043 /ORGANISM="Entomoneis sp., Strain CCMP2396" /LENGTH=195 /DNA_ID=CAMNT_0043805635 /DNA_START=71 /DNA_END=658 /DNA_ORIENTATION=-